LEKTGVAVPIFVVCVVIVGAIGAFAGYKMAPTAAPAELADGSVTTPKLADGAVTSAKIADGAVTTSDLAMGAASQAVGVTRIADVSTSSTLFVDVPDMTINITTEDNPVLILFSMNIYHVKTASGSVRVRLLVDGAGEATWEQFDYTGSSAWYSCPITVLKFFSAGAHTINVQWSVDTGTAYNPATFGYRSLTVIELKNASP